MKDSYLARDGQTRIIPNTHFSTLMDAVLKTGRPFRFQAAGFSMSPFIMDGDNIMVSPVDTKSIHTGDILAIINPIYDNLLVHRVVACRTGKYLIKADNSRKPDGWVAVEKVIGVVSSIERGTRRIHFGLGGEKWLIALFSRCNCLQTSIRLLCRLFPPAIKRHFV